MAYPVPFPVGSLDIKRHLLLRSRGVDLHVFYNSEDVTDRCTYADDTPGKQVARLFKLNELGKKHLDPATNAVAMETVEGDIQIRTVSR